MSVSGAFERRVRGFRLVDVILVALGACLCLGGYVSKTMAGRQRAEITSVDSQITDEKGRVRLLRAEVAYLEQPQRIERLSGEFLGMKPTNAKQEVQPAALSDLAKRGPKP